MLDAMTGNWWATALRGGATVLFGLLALVTPGLTLDGLVSLFGAYALLDGTVALFLGWRARAAGADARELLVGAVTSVAIGLVTLLWADVNAFELLLLVGVRALVAGLAEGIAALRGRREGPADRLTVVVPAVAAAFGLLFLVIPATGADTVLWWIALYGFAVGALHLALGLRLRGAAHGDSDARGLSAA
ncbi:protein of unknown function DUF308 membrane [Gemmatirosa kalamazoonensis]|uniref:Uncharacterized protein n=1 Tax=Gemmatirosa kalamazoonensis TaxID=861299 RepID=W0RGX2_9BACT|nr:DUF308 domain-containing protein [Gemmatirosa kalamazoonensis]AHG89580.1 protein of unknown function DUF308 membrane [Gemmatirosa kalamazoonensis]